MCELGIKDYFLLASAIAIILSTIVNVLLHFNNRSLIKQQDKNIKERDLQSKLNHILTMGMKYPLLESKTWANDWINHKEAPQEHYLRYDIYCTMLFNYLDELYKFYNYNKSELEANYLIKDWVKIHKVYWENPSNEKEHEIGYSKELNKLIKEYLK